MASEQKTELRWWRENGHMVYQLVVTQADAVRVGHRTLEQIAEGLRLILAALREPD